MGNCRWVRVLPDASHRRQEAGKDAEARTALQAAINADPDLDAAYQRLCELEERGRNEKAGLAADFPLPFVGGLVYD